MRTRTIVLATMAMCVCALAGAQVVDLTKPLEADKDTLNLYHLDDVATGEVKDAVAGGKAGKVADATEVEGKFGKAMAADGTKGWVDFADLAPDEKETALTVECWVKFNDKPKGDIVTRNTGVMMRIQSGKVMAYFNVDGKWRIVTGKKELPTGKWTHVAITWDSATKEECIYVDGELDVKEVPAELTEGKLRLRGNLLRLGNDTWAPGLVLNGALDEVRISSVARKYGAPAAAPIPAPAPAPAPLKPEEKPAK